jgi:hypothetical protein
MLRVLPSAQRRLSRRDTSVSIPKLMRSTGTLDPHGNVIYIMEESPQKPQSHPLDHHYGRKYSDSDSDSDIRVLLDGTL